MIVDEELDYGQTDYPLSPLIHQAWDFEDYPLK